LVSGQTIALSGNYDDGAIDRLQELEQLPIALLRRHADVYQRQAQRQSGAAGQIRLDETRPGGRDFARDFGIAVSGQVGKNDLGVRFPWPAYFEEIDAAGASRRGTGLGDFRSQQGINDAGFADVGAA